MNPYEFHENELLHGQKRFLFGCELTELSTPITPKENMFRALDSK